ncbi:uncharacterized protein LOC131597376 [Vicia villosa]|uniref:uncharacterized protein LOC131597376 n=1 Tax=Vicia villosa TaxID=3911 RepID=UPI00273AFB3E|nr:uncharacterized protein LOC131597376 [Vicia villosa]
MGGWIDGSWTWGNFGIPAASLLHSVVDFSSLSQLLAATASFSPNLSDTACWHQGVEGVFSVSSCYKSLNRQHIPLGPDNRFDLAFIALWKVEAPLKVKAFGWRCFLNKVPMKDSLLSKGILNSTANLECTFCDEFHESLYHSFLSCRNAGIVWREMSDWIGMTFKSILDFKEDFWYLSSYCRAKKVKRGKERIVWLAIIWSLWLRRNDIVFNNATWNSRDVV